MLNKILNWGLIILVFLIPLFFLPITTDFYEFNKNILLIIACGLLLVGWGLKMVLAKKVSFVRTPFDLPVLLFAASFALSVIFASTNRVEALFLPGGAGTILALALLYFIITNNLPSSSSIIHSLLASASLLSLIAIYQFIGVGEALIPAGTGQAFEWLKAKTFSPTGGPLTLATFLAVCLALVVARVYTDWKKNRQSSFLYLNLLVMFLTAAGLGITSYQLLSTAKPILLPQSAGWVIALEAFKRFPLFGVGPENFISAFTAGRPIGLNLTQFWALRFGTSANFYFHLLTTVGILGFGAWLYLVWKVIKTRPFSVIHYPLFVIFIALIFLPGNFLLISASFLLLALLGATLTTGKFEEESRILPWIFLGFFLAVAGSSLYFTLSRVFAAEHYFNQSLNAIAQNKGTDAYNLQIKAIQTNPYNNTYRAAYSQINLALASAIAGNPPAGGLTDQDRQNINQLVQQAIAEAKTAISLAPANVITWENLASIYRNLINVAQGADTWSIAAYNQAIFLDPTNSLLRLNAGGVYYTLKNYDEAIRQFTIAVNLKPDFANGHYNLAVAYREKGLIKEAVGEMEQAQALVEPSSNDFQKASQELADLRAKLPKEETKPAGTPETLTPPASPPAGIKPPLTLPEEAKPPSEGTPSGR